MKIKGPFFKKHNFTPVGKSKTGGGITKGKVATRQPRGKKRKMGKRSR